MKESVTSEKLDAMYEAFSDERLRWLIGKGDLLVQKGELDNDKLEDLISKAVGQEYERHLILDALEGEERTISEIAKLTKLPSHEVFSNIIALTKWNKVVVTQQKGNEYLYSSIHTPAMQASE